MGGFKNHLSVPLRQEKTLTRKKTLLTAAAIS